MVARVLTPLGHGNCALPCQRAFQSWIDITVGSLFQNGIPTQDSEGDLWPFANNDDDGFQGYTLRRSGSRKCLGRAREDLIKLQIDRMIPKAHCPGPGTELISLIIDNRLR